MLRVTGCRRMVLLAICVFAFLDSLSMAADDLDKDWRLLNGRWKTVSWYEEGRQRDVSRQPVSLVFDNGRLTVCYSNNRSVTLKIRLDSSTSPKSFDTWYDGDDPEACALYQNRVYHGIYEIDGDKLKRCFTLRGGLRPKEFKQGKDLPTSLTELERTRE